MACCENHRAEHSRIGTPMAMQARKRIAAARSGVAGKTALSERGRRRIGAGGGADGPGDRHQRRSPNRSISDS
jgi:hypothetical protein